MLPQLRPRLVLAIGVGICLVYLISSAAYSYFPSIKGLASKQDQNAGNHEPPTSDNSLEAIQPAEAPRPATPEGQHTEDFAWMNDLEGSADVRFPLKFARRDIIFRPVPRGPHDPLITAKEKLLPKFQEFDSFDTTDRKLAHTLKPVTLEIPIVPKPNTSHILLGTASTVERLEASLPFFQRWLAYSGIHLIVNVNGPDDTPPDSKAMAEMETRMRDLGMQATLVPPLSKHDSFVQRCFSLVKTLYEHNDEQTQWLGFIDDDTFFVSMTHLVERLAEFDHTKQFYLGALSEQWWTVVAYGVAAMGGGGIFLSVPLAKILVQNYDDCKENTRRTFGDQIIYDCIIRHSQTRLTQVDGLYQIDMHGDRSGVFESGRVILSLHHWKEGYWSEDGEGWDGIRHPRWFPMDKMALVQDVCGDNCFLQRFHFKDDIILTNGYSVASYPTGALKKLLPGKLFATENGQFTSFAKIERTWSPAVEVPGAANDGFEHYLCPCRPPLQLEVDKIHWRLMEAKTDGEGGVRQYFRRVGREGRVDEWVELHFSRDNAANRP